MNTARTRPLALTIGDPAGIGPDILIQAWLKRDTDDVPPFLVVGGKEVLAKRARLMGLDVSIAAAEGGDAGELFSSALPVMELENEIAGRAGEPSVGDAPAVIEAIDTAVALTIGGETAALVTCPIAKAVLYRAGFAHPGHTEYLEHLARKHAGRPCKAVMMLAGPDLRTVPVTIHVPLADVPSLLTTPLIVDTGLVVADELRRRFAILEPRLTVCGLNPHAGEGGAIGDEDERVIRPAVENLVAQGVAAIGPMPADTVFHAEARKHYDAVLGMYHDQALIPAKALAFDRAVNVTLGLPFVRTSPDHGTAFALAGSGKASPSSLIAALQMAARLANAESR